MCPNADVCVTQNKCKTKKKTKHPSLSVMIARKDEW